MLLVKVISIFQVMVTVTSESGEAFIISSHPSLISSSSLNCIVELVFEENSISADTEVPQKLLLLHTLDDDSNNQKIPLTCPLDKLIIYVEGNLKDVIAAFPCKICITSFKIDGVYNTNSLIYCQYVSVEKEDPIGETDTACCKLTKIAKKGEIQCSLIPEHFGSLLIFPVVLAVTSAFAIVTIRCLKITSKQKEEVLEKITPTLNRESLQHQEDGNNGESTETDGYRERGTSLSLELNNNYNFEMEKNSFFINKNKFLGKGEFGEVYGGFFDKFNGIVAFKSSKKQCSVRQMKSLLSEFMILSYIGFHKNIVNLLGVYTQEIQNRIFYMALECCLDSLESCLRSNRKLFLKNRLTSIGSARKNSLPVQPSQCEKNSFDTMEILCKWSSEIANGMEFLGNKRVMHLDLAARNILLHGDSAYLSKTVAKIADFGLSRKLDGLATEYIKTGNDALPWRWLALESLQNNIYSSKTDVWSYGITLWEIFSLSEIPYPSQMSVSKDFIDELENGLRNGKPSLATEEIYEIMMECWQSDPKKRPEFLHLKQFFQDQNQTNAIIKNQKYTLKETGTALSANPYISKDEFVILMSES